jgi:hypothetical protein
MAAAVLSQESQNRRFESISHSPQETVAIDSTGQEWYYDAESAEFVTEDEYKKSAGRQRESYDKDDIGPDKIILPPEIRCTDIHDGDITELFSEVVVKIDQRIEGSITSAQNVTVKGLVTGKIISYRTVIVESTGEVRGDVIAREIIRDRGGRILGQRSEVPFPEAFGIGVPRVSGIMPGFGGILFTGFLIFICVIMIALFPKQLERIVAKIGSGPVKSFFWGVLVWFSILPLFVLLIITIVGIPIAILIFPFVIIAAIIMGYVAAAIYIGKRLSPRFNWQDKSIYFKGIVGVVAIAALRLVGNILIFIGAEGLGIFLGVLYIIFASVALTVGVGSVISSKFGARPKPAGPAPGVARPPGQPHPMPPVTPPPPPRTEPLPPQVTPPPPVPPPAPKSGNATD